MNRKALDEELKAAALDYHRRPVPGKIAVTPTKGLTNQRDLALAYSPALRRPARRSPPIRPRRRSSPPGGTWWG